jgi:SAM-dependent methyltransferase
MTAAENDLGDDGERVVASNLDWNYYSHLSVYRFASTYTKGLRVFDAGCGTGYGTAYLARAGAQHVTGIDISEKAISYCRAHFSAPATDFVVADLSLGIPIPTGSTDAIFSSQAMEHLSDIEKFLSECRRVLKPDGLMVVAVPAITSRQQLEENIWNRFHITNLTPLGWYTKMRRNFARVVSFSHWPVKRFSGWSEIRDALRLSPQDTVIRETDFDYVATPISVLNSHPETLNTVLVARRPRRRPWPPQVEEFVPHAWGEGAIHAKVRHEETELLRWKLWQATESASVADGGARS